MNQYVFHLGEFGGSALLEFRKGNNHKERKFSNSDSLYVSDDAFFFFLEYLFRHVVSTFDMFEDTCISKKQWSDVMRLSIPDLLNGKFADEAMKTLETINGWVEEHVADDEEFIVIGV